MSTDTLEGAGLLVRPRPPLLGRMWRGGLQGSEYTWAIAFTVPYIGLFLAFVAYPVAFGAWLGQRSEPLRRAGRGSDLPAHDREHDPLCRHRREPQDVRCAAAVGLLHAARLVGQGPAAGLRAAVGDAGAAGVHLDPLDAQRRVGPVQQLPVQHLRHRRAGLARHLALAGARGGHRVAHLEVDAVLDRDPAGRPHGDPAGALRGGRGRRRHRA